MRMCVGMRAGNARKGSSRVELTSPPERIFQKRNVSSAAAVTTVVPSGDCAMWSTREVWPVSSATLTIDGYFHRMSWLCE